MVNTINKKKIRFLHVMPQSSEIYDAAIIEMINTSIIFDRKEHMFLVFDEDIFNNNSSYSNLIFSRTSLNENFGSFIDFINISDFVILHSNTLSLTNLYRLKKKELKKIVWCVWGHDLYVNQKKSENNYKNNIRQILKKIYYLLYDYKIKNILGIGIGFRYDALEVKMRFGSDMEILNMPYIAKELNLEYFKNDYIELINRPMAPKRLMIGHCAYPFLNHKKILKMLERYKKENIIISLVFAYGSKVYADEVTKYANEIFGGKVEIITEKMNLKSYIRYLKTVDVAIFDHTHQSALSNIYYLLYLNKKIYLNNKGIIAQGMKLEGIEFAYTNDIGNISFEELSKINNCNRGKLFAKYYIDSKNIVSQWAKTINELNKTLN